MINHIKTTKNSKGLKVDAHLVAKHYEKGKKFQTNKWLHLKSNGMKYFQPGIIL